MQKQRGEDEHAGGEVRVQRHGAEAGLAVQVGKREVGRRYFCGHLNLEMHS